MKPITVNASDATAILANLRKEYDSGLNHKRPRISSWQKNDKRVNGDVKAPKRSLNNFHIPILAGFEDAWLAKMDERMEIVFGSDQPGEKRLAKKYESLHRFCSERPGREWAHADLDANKGAVRYGRGILKMIGFSKPFGIELEAVDAYDFTCDPLCGKWLRKARYWTIDSIFRSKYEMKAGVKAGRYDREAVNAMVTEDENAQGQDNLTESMTDAMSRFSSLKLDGYGYTGAGEKSYRICESGTTYHGVRYYCVWSPEANQLLRCQTMKEAFGIPDKAGIWNVFAWAPNDDKKVFWSKAPDDDVSDVAEFERQTLMYASDGLITNVWGGKAYDPDVFDAGDLIPQPSGLYPSKKGASKTGSGLAGAIVEMKAGEYRNAFDIIQNLDGFVGQKSGINLDTQGTSNEDVLGIAQQNIEQASDRLGRVSKSRMACYVEIGQAFLYMAKKFIVGKKPVRFIGPDGYEFEELAAREIDPSMGVTVKGGRAEESMSAVKRRDKVAALTDIANNPELPKWVQEERLRLGGYEDTEIRQMMSEGVSNDQIDRANESVEILLEGKAAKIYQGADETFVRTILTAAQKYTPSDGPEFDRLLAYAKAHKDIVAENMAMKFMRESRPMPMAEEQAPEMGAPPPVTPPQAPVPPVVAAPQM